MPFSTFSRLSLYTSIPTPPTVRRRGPNIAIRFRPTPQTYAYTSTALCSVAVAFASISSLPPVIGTITSATRSLMLCLRLLGAMPRSDSFR